MLMALPLIAEGLFSQTVCRIFQCFLVKGKHCHDDQVFCNSCGAETSNRCSLLRAYLGKIFIFYNER
jgi:hypothetical protein